MTKIDIFSGFLGAGKTTLIKKLIAEAYSGEKLVLIENEFGEINIDGGFLKESGIEISEMSAGCICCSLVGDFNKALKEVVAQFHPDRILIEPSGVGKLSDVIVAVERTVDECLGELKLNSYVTVADASKVKVYMKNFGEFYNNQVESAHTIVLSRTQNMKQDKLEACVAMIREHNKDAAVITTPWDEIKGEQILKVIEGQDTMEAELLAEAHHREEEEHEHHHDHEHHHEHEYAEEHVYTHEEMHIHSHDEGHTHDHDHAHSHAHGHHSHTSVAAILEQISKLDMSDAVKRDAEGIYRNIAAAESKVHQTDMEQIHFHEVGSVDALIDVVGSCLALELLGVDEVQASPVCVGNGTVRCAHGILPVPAPATAEIIKGMPVYCSSFDGELLTPTGAAILKYFVKTYTKEMHMEIEEIGYGFGTKDFAQLSCVRAFLGYQK